MILRLSGLRALSTILFVVLFVLSVQSQTIHITGKVLEMESKSPIEFATIMLVDTISGNSIDGTTTLMDGSFVLTTNKSNFVIDVSFIGYERQRLTDLSIKQGTMDLGIVYLKANQTILDEAEIVGEKSQTVFKLDKRVFNVGKDLSQSGASALDVLNNVPSVTVDIEGQISLRGNQGVQILINGKPSVLTNDGSGALGTITADMIERVEVITNPSAKYQAEGTTGIINIILKKDEKKGMNGSITLNGGIPMNNSFGLSLNKRTEKFNLFTQVGAGRRSLPRYQTTSNVDLQDSSVISSDGVAFRNETFFNGTLGADYHLNKLNVISLSGSLAYEWEDGNSEYDFVSVESGEPEATWKRGEDTKAVNPKYQYDLQYARDFKRHEEQMLIMSATGSFFGKDQESTFEDQTITGDRPSESQFSNTKFKQANYTFKLDYTHPFKEYFKLEAGAHYRIDDNNNDFETGYFEGDVAVISPELSNVFHYRQNVLGVYSTLDYEREKFGFKAGLRVEDTDLDTRLITTGEQNSQRFANFFPSAHASYKFTEKFSAMAGYSRRIQRPSPWRLNPFVNIRNNYSLSKGNPLLLPEYTDSYEITGLWNIEKASFNLGVYHRFTEDVVETVTTFEDNRSLRMPLNIGTNELTGIEFNTKYSPFKKLDLRGDFNWNTFDRKASHDGISYDYDGTKWSVRASANMKLPYKFELEISGDYRSGFKTIQGEQKENAFANLGIRKKFMKGKLVANMSVRDVFASAVWQNETIQTDFETYSESRRGRFFTLGVSYSLGKGEAMEYSARKRF